jgi:SNF2 family DNA or RNA helicase
MIHFRGPRNMKMTWNGARFLLYHTVEERLIAQKAGFQWDANIRASWTGLTFVAQTFKQYADPTAISKIGYEDDQIALSHAVDSNLNIPVPDGLSYLSFQKVVAEYALRRKDTLIADGMGSGKTIEAISVINILPEVKRVLVICPASLRINWSRELMLWLFREFTGGFAIDNEFPDTNIVITNWEQVKKFRKRIDKVKWDIAIFDESHMAKNPSSQRTRASLGWISESGKTNIPPIDAGMRLYLTGTPILNRPVELWPILRVADPLQLGASEYQYQRTYCNAWDAPWGWDASGASKKNLEDLQKRLRSKLMIRRTKEQVLPQLPPKRRQIIILPEEASRLAVQAELDFYEKNQSVIDEALQKAEQTQSGDDLGYQAAADQLVEGKAASFKEMSRLRHATGVAKIPYIIEYLEQALEQQNKVVCFCHHIDVIEAIVKHFKKLAVGHHGGMNDAEKQKARDRFQGTKIGPDDKTCRLFVSGITLAIGFDLTIAELAVIGELDWRAGIVSQAEDRLHRIGQLGYVLIQHLIFDNSLDSRMILRIIEKQIISERALG